MLDTLLFFIENHAASAPFVIVALCLLAGLNIPLSEDVLNISLALLAGSYPEYAWLFGISICLGALTGDIVSYGVGYGVQGVLVKSRRLHKERTVKLYDGICKLFAHKGPVLLIIGRFIPFGFRNILHMSAGSLHMPLRTYILFDSIAVLLTTGVLYSVVFLFGQKVAMGFQRTGLFLAGFLLLGFVISFFGKKYIVKKTASSEEMISK